MSSPGETNDIVDGYAPLSTVGEVTEPVAALATKTGLVLERNSAGQVFICKDPLKVTGLSFNKPDGNDVVGIKRQGKWEAWSDSGETYVLDMPLKAKNDGSGLLVPWLNATDKPESLIAYVDEMPYTAAGPKQYMMYVRIRGC
jgi:hypothetical protein